MKQLKEPQVIGDLSERELLELIVTNQVHFERRLNRLEKLAEMQFNRDFKGDGEGYINIDRDNALHYEHNFKTLWDNHMSIKRGIAHHLMGEDAEPRSLVFDNPGQ